MDSKWTQSSNAHRHASALSDTIQKRAKYEDQHHDRNFSKDQRDLALHLANDFSGPQRKDGELLNHMRMKQIDRQGTTKGLQVLPLTCNSMPQSRSDNSWEAIALQGIKKKALSLDRGWNEKTWINKSSIHERLKLLKDSGVDITPLQGPKVSSESITKVVLAQALARKQNPSSQVRSQSSSGKHTVSLKVNRHEQHAQIPLHDSCFDHLRYRPGPTPSLKRNRDDSSDAKLAKTLKVGYTSNQDEPASKKQCRIDLRTTQKESTMQCEEDVPSWDVLKHTILTHIFPSCPSEGYIQTTPSRIVIAFPSQSAIVDVPGELELNSKGYENIMYELRALSNTTDENGTISIQDPAALYSEIRITTNIPRRTIIEGNAEVLARLISRLRTPGNGLAHMAKRFFDEEGVRQSKGQVYELSARTQEQLAKIEEAVEEGWDVGVGWHDVGRSPGWPKKMY
jgi:hypothetical protein